MAATNVPPIPKDRIRGFPNGSSINHYLLEHPNTVLATVEFDISSATNIGFSIQTNSSVQWFKGKFQDPNLYVQLPLQVAIEREASKILANQTTLKWNVDISQFPHPSAKVMAESTCFNYFMKCSLPSSLVSCYLLSNAPLCVLISQVQSLKLILSPQSLLCA